jgi:hypothetical protein
MLPYPLTPAAPFPTGALSHPTGQVVGDLQPNDHEPDQEGQAQLQPQLGPQLQPEQGPQLQPQPQPQQGPQAQPEQGPQPNQQPGLIVHVGDGGLVLIPNMWLMQQQAAAQQHLQQQAHPQQQAQPQQPPVLQEQPPPPLQQQQQLPPPQQQQQLPPPPPQQQQQQQQQLLLQQLGAPLPFNLAVRPIAPRAGELAPLADLFEAVGAPSLERLCLLGCQFSEPIDTKAHLRLRAIAAAGGGGRAGSGGAGGSSGTGGGSGRRQLMVMHCDEYDESVHGLPPTLLDELWVAGGDGM